MRSRFLETLAPWQRVIMRVEVDFSSGCWNYISSNASHGYGQITWRENGITQHDLAHRVIFRKFKGEIPKGMEVCHTCDNKLCVNPAHLWHGTRAQNMKDAFDKGLSKGTFPLAAYDAFKEKKRRYQREWRRKNRERKRGIVRS